MIIDTWVKDYYLYQLIPRSRYLWKSLVVLNLHEHTQHGVQYQTRYHTSVSYTLRSVLTLQNRKNLTPRTDTKYLLMALHEHI